MMNFSRKAEAQRQFTFAAESEIPFPPRLSVGEGSPLLVGGWICSEDPEEKIKNFEVMIDGVSSQPISERLPRKDVYLSNVDAHREDPSRKTRAMDSFRSGFLAVAEIPASAAGRTVPVELVAYSGNSRRKELEIGQLTLMPNPAPGPEVEWPRGSSEPRVAIAMATYSPERDLLSGQITSIKHQTHENWTCLISDDDGTSESLALIEEAIDGDDRFRVSQASDRLGFYSNFERALEMVPESADLIALADQDDVWHRDKLAALIGPVSQPGVGLAYSDARIVDRSGQVIHPSYWSTGRTNNFKNLGSLLVANTVTGAASIFTPEVLRLALPFPHTPVNSFHDHWIACVALATSRIEYVDRPLYDYVQHREAVLGFEQTTSGLDAPKAQPFRSLKKTLRDTNPRSDSALTAEARLLPMSYYFGSTRMIVLASALLMRCGKRISRRKKRVIQRAASLDQSLVSLCWLLLRRNRRHFGRGETMDIERAIAKGLLWRRVIGLRSRLARNPARVVSDARVPVLQEASSGESFRQ